MKRNVIKLFVFISGKGQCGSTGLRKKEKVFIKKIILIL